MLKDSTDLKRLTELFSREVYCFPSAFSGNDKRPWGGYKETQEKKSIFLNINATTNADI